MRAVSLAEVEFSMARNDLGQAAYPPPSRVAAPFGQMHRSRGLPPRRGVTQGLYVLQNADGTSRLVSVRG